MRRLRLERGFPATLLRDDGTPWPALESPKPKHLAAITDPLAIGGLLRAIDGYRATFVTKSALKIAPLVFVRPGELRHAE